MSLLKIYDKARQRRCRDALALRIAARSRAAAWKRLGAAVRSMNQSQARGYIRARVGVVVEREQKIAMSTERHVGSTDQHEIAQLAIDLLVQHLLTDLAANQRSGAQLLQAA